MSRTKKKSGFGKFICILLLIAVTLGLSAGLTKLTDGYSKSLLTIFNNKDNLVHTLEEYESEAGKDAHGITWSVNNRGAILCEGTAEGSAEFIVGTVTIEEDGKYTISGLEGASMTTAYIQGSYVDADGVRQTFYGDMKDVSTVELAKGDQVTIKVIVVDGATVDVACYPTLVKGTEAGKF